MTDLRTKTTRKRIAPRSSAYMNKLSEGRALGYRKRKADQPGRWLLRTYAADGKYAFETLGTADDVADADGQAILSYAQALEMALGKSTADPTRLTVQQALDDWAKAKASEASTAKAKRDFHSSARRIGKAFPGATLKSITTRQISDWAAADTRPARATANRLLATLKAALTRAADLNGYEGKRRWVAAKLHSKTDSFGARTVILTEAEENRLIAACQPDAARLMTALQLTGARVGEIRNALVGDLHGDRLTLAGKTGRRTINLSPDKAEWFAIVAGNRPDPEPLLTREDGTGWGDGDHLRPVRQAVLDAGLAKEVTAYALRHGFITRALTRGAPVVAVAQHCGNSTAMIENSYAKFLPSDMAGWF